MRRPQCSCHSFSASSSSFFFLVTKSIILRIFSSSSSNVVFLPGGVVRLNHHNTLRVFRRFRRTAITTNDRLLLLLLLLLLSNGGLTFRYLFLLLLLLFLQLLPDIGVAVAQRHCVSFLSLSVCLVFRLRLGPHDHFALLLLLLPLRTAHQFHSPFDSLPPTGSGTRRYLSVKAVPV